MPMFLEALHLSTTSYCIQPHRLSKEEASDYACLKLSLSAFAECLASGACSLRGAEAGMLGQSLYGSEQRWPDHSPSEDTVHRMNSVGAVSRKSSIQSMASSFVSNPLLRSSNDLSSKTKQHQKPVVPQIIVVGTSTPSV